MIGIFEISSSLFLGLIASFAPCMFPILPSFVALIAQTGSVKQLNEENSKKFQESKPFNSILASILVTLGIMTVFLIFGTVIQALTGNFFSDNYLFFRFFQGVLLVLIGVLLVFKISFGTLRLSKLSSSAQGVFDKVKNPWILSYLIGFFFSLLAAPCSVIVFGALFVLTGNASFIETVILLIIFSIGAGIPFFLIAGIIPSLKQMTAKKSRFLFQVLPQITGVLIILTGFLLMFDAYTLSTL